MIPSAKPSQARPGSGAGAAEGHFGDEVAEAHHHEEVVGT